MQVTPRRYKPHTDIQFLTILEKNRDQSVGHSFHGHTPDNVPTCSHPVHKGNLTSRDLSCRKPHTQAATDTGDTKNSGMKTRSQKRVPLSIPSQTSTSNISSNRWMPTAINMALNSTHVSPSALKRGREANSPFCQFARQRCHPTLPSRLRLGICSATQI